MGNGRESNAVLKCESKAVHFVSYLDEAGELQERVVTPLSQAKEMVGMLEAGNCIMLTVIKAANPGKPIVIYDDGEWYPNGKPQLPETNAVA